MPVEVKQQPYAVRAEDGTLVAGATTQPDAVVLAGAVFARVGGFYQITDDTGALVAEIGLDQPPSPVLVGLALQSINPASQMQPLLQVLTCTGTGFEQGAEILFDDVRQTTTFTDETTVSARLDYSGAPGEKCAVQVRNPDGETSGTLYFEFLAP